MAVDWVHAWPTVAAAFLASLVEFVEALTVVLAVGTVRGWREALIGTGSALGLLLAIVVALGPALTRIPLEDVQLVVGGLLLLFGMRWLRKAILRSADVIPLRDEEASYEKEAAASGRCRSWLGHCRDRYRLQDHDARRAILAHANWSGLILFGGLILILIESTVRALPTIRSSPIISVRRTSYRANGLRSSTLWRWPSAALVHSPSGASTTASASMSSLASPSSQPCLRRWSFSAASERR